MIVQPRDVPSDGSRLSPARRIGFLTLDHFPMLALSCAIEVLHTVNQVTDRAEYEWMVMAPSGGSIESSDGTVRVAPSQSAAPKDFDLFFVCGNGSVTNSVDEDLIAFLRETHLHGVVLGGLCSGAYALAKAGLLDGYSCTLQWNDMESLQTLFPNVRFLDQLSVIDRDRATCGGGIAPVDLMLRLADRHVCSETLHEVANLMGAAYRPETAAKNATRRPVLLSSEHHTLTRVLTLMRNNLEEPYSSVELAEKAGISVRQLQRLFQLSHGTTPSEYYLRMRLERARELVLTSQLSLTEVTVSMGFASLSHFSRSYKAYYGCAPSVDRRHRQLTPPPMSLVED